MTKLGHFFAISSFFQIFLTGMENFFAKLREIFLRNVEVDL